MSTSGSGAPPRPTRKMVLRKIPKEVSFPSATPEAAPHPVKSRLPGSAPAFPPPPPPPAAARRSAPAIRTDLPPPPAPSQPPAASVATPIPSRISVLPFVAPISPATSDSRRAPGSPPRYVLIVCGIALSGVLVGAGVLLGSRMDEPSARANGTGTHQAATASTAPPSGSPQVSRDQTPTISNPLIATANVNDLPRAPMPVFRRWTPPANGAAARISAARATATAAPPVAAPEPATEQTSESSDSAVAATPAAAAPAPRASASTAPPAPAAVLEKEDAPPAKSAPSATAQVSATPDPAPSAPPDPLLDEMKKAVGGSPHK